MKKLLFLCSFLLLITPITALTADWDFDGRTGERFTFRILEVNNTSPGLCPDSIIFRFPGQPEITEKGCADYSYTHFSSRTGAGTIDYLTYDGPPGSGRHFQIVLEDGDVRRSESHLQQRSDTYLIALAATDITMTTEELQATGGIVDVPSLGQFTFPWGAMNPGEVITIEFGSESPNFTAITPASASFKVTAPESVQSYELVPDVGSGQGDLMLGTKSGATNFIESGNNWSFLYLVDGRFLVNHRDLYSAVKVILFGQSCDYDFNDVVVSWYRFENCEPVPSSVIEIVTWTRMTRASMGDIGFDIKPMQRVNIVEGEEDYAWSKYGVSYLNATKFNQESVAWLQGVTVHETFHSIHYWPLERDISNHITEPAAVWAMWRVGAPNVWVGIYSFTSDDLLRGLNPIISRNTQEKYNPAWFFFLSSAWPSFNMASFFQNQAEHIIAGDSVSAFMQEMDWSNEKLSREWAKTVSMYHQDDFPLLGVNGAFGFTQPQVELLNEPTNINIATSVLWNDPEAEAANFFVTGNPINSDTLITFGKVGDHVDAIHMDGTLTSMYPINGPLEPTDYIITASSVFGVSGPDQHVTARIEPLDQPSCQGMGPTVIGSFENATMFNANCDVIPDPNTFVRAEIYAGSTITHNCPTVTLGVFSIITRVPKDVEWPKFVVGQDTGGSVPKAYWPTQYTPSDGTDICNRPIGSVYSAGIVQTNHYQQQVTWTWDCNADGNCYDQNARPSRL